jgi:hypothetical protein
MIEKFIIFSITFSAIVMTVGYVGTRLENSFTAHVSN